MELYELGIITNKETDGLELRFGNDEAVIEMIHASAKERDFSATHWRRWHSRFQEDRQELLQLPDPRQRDEQPPFR